MNKILLLFKFVFLSSLILLTATGISNSQSEKLFSSGNFLRPGSEKSDTGNFGSYTPGKGFKIVSTSKGEVNFRIYSNIRYLNQLGLDSTYTNAFGRTSVVRERQDIQLTKVNAQFTGWLMDPKFTWLFFSPLLVFQKVCRSSFNN